MLYRLKGLQKDFGRRRILDIDEISLEKGRIYSLRGANGAGKSTLLSILSFLDTPSAGMLQFLGQDVSDNILCLLRKKVVLVDQSPLLFSGSVYHNVEFGLKVRRVARQERKKRAAAALEQVGMSSFIKADARRLSGGETKRIALARALAVNPEVLLLDEPAANVDLKNQEIIFDIIREVNRQFGTSVIFSTHHAPDGAALEDNALTLINGRLIKEMERNTFAGRMVMDGKFMFCRLDGSHIRLEMPQEQFREGDAVTVHIKPELVGFVQPEQDQTGVYDGQVIKLAMQDEKVFYTLDCGLKLLAESSLSSYQHYPLQLGQKVLVHIPDTALTIRKKG